MSPHGNESETHDQGGNGGASDPAWVAARADDGGEPLVVPEWEELPEHVGHRAASGWSGTDLVHAPDAPVRIDGYRVRYRPGGGVGTTLTGVARFTRRAESHRGHCHGGGMCGLMDDVMGWCGFSVTGRCRPWSGFTAQINTSLRRPVPVDACLLIEATIVRTDGRKVTLEARLYDPDQETQPYATGEGLFLVQRGLLPEEPSDESAGH